MTGLEEKSREELWSLSLKFFHSLDDVLRNVGTSGMS